MNAHVFEKMVGKLTPLIVGSSVEQAVDFAQSTEAICHSGHTIAEGPLQAQSLFQV